MLPCSELHPTLCVWCPCSPSTSLSPSRSRSAALTLASVYISYARSSVSSIVLCYYDSPANAVYHTKQIIFLIFSANLANFSLLHAHSFSLFHTLSLFFFLFFSLSCSVSYNFLILCVVFLPFLCSSFLYSVFSAN